MQTKIIGHNGATLIVPQSYEFQNGNGTNGRQPSKWEEIGSSGLESYSGFITEAYHADLFWPGVYPLYNRLRRSDPEIAIVRQFYSAMARQVNIEVVEPDKASSKEGKLVEFYQSELANMDGGIRGFLDQHLGNVPFMGWGWWETVPGVRSKEWRPPGDDNWESEADDGLVGVRRLAWRDQSSFDSWNLTDETARLKGMWQQDYPNARVLLPLDRSLHITFGDNINPEGLTPLEAVWRLERIKFQLEIIKGHGYEKAAGYLDVRKTADSPLSTEDKTNIRNAARAILSAQEGNYAAWPFGFEGKVMDIPFSAAATLLEDVRYYGLLKLQLYNMDWVSIASTAGTGAYSARADASSTFMMAFNAMIAGAVDQYDSQVGKRLYKWNAGSFAGARRPKYVAKPLDKIVNLGELAEFWKIIKETMPVGEQDFIEIRTRSGILPETLPEPKEMVTMPKPEPADDRPEPDTAETDDDTPDPDKEVEGELSELASPADYGDKIAALILRASDGRIQRPAFVKQMKELTTNQLIESFAAGAGIKPDDITDEQLTALLDDLEAHEDSIGKLADDIYIGGIAERTNQEDNQ